MEPVLNKWIPYVLIMVGVFLLASPGLSLSIGGPDPDIPGETKPVYPGSPPPGSFGDAWYLAKPGLVNNARWLLLGCIWVDAGVHGLVWVACPDTVEEPPSVPQCKFSSVTDSCIECYRELDPTIRIEGPEDPPTDDRHRSDTDEPLIPVVGVPVEGVALLGTGFILGGLGLLFLRRKR